MAPGTRPSSGREPLAARRCSESPSLSTTFWASARSAFWRGVIISIARRTTAHMSRCGEKQNGRMSEMVVHLEWSCYAFVCP